MSRNQTDFSYDELIQKCDEWIRSGQIHLATRLISQLQLAKVPRKKRKDLAKICRRSGLISLGLRLLQPIVRSESNLAQPATENEICEYAVLLVRNGSVQEALKLLERVDGEKTPEAFLNLAYCYMPNWDYAQAAVHLEKFLKANVDDYSKLVARVNLAASYHATYQLDLAEELLKETIPLAQKAASKRLLVNCLDLMGHVSFQRNDFSKAREHLNEALSMLGPAQTYDHLLIRKTEAFMLGLEQKSIEPLLKFREEAWVQSHWESVREVDMYRAKIQFEQKNFDHLVFGSPLPAFRERIQTEVSGAPSEVYIYGDPKPQLMDMGSGRITGADFNAGKKIHQVLSVLTKDFYAPKNIGSLFSDLYPNEWFDISTSPHRVNQLLSRTRLWLSENQIGASINEINGTYRLVLQNGFGIQMSLEDQPVDKENVRWKEVTSIYADGSEVSASQVCSKLGWPHSKFKRTFGWALENRKVQKIGNGKYTSYLILEPNTFRKAS